MEKNTEQWTPSSTPLPLAKDATRGFLLALYIGLGQGFKKGSHVSPY